MAVNLDSDVLAFLDKFTNVTNTLACIVRSFSSIEYMRILAAVGVIIGTHLVEPFLSLTTSSTTDYNKLIPAFQLLYQNLVTVKPELMLDFTSPALSFVSTERFKACLYPTELLQPTVDLIEQYRTEVVQFLSISYLS